MRMDLGGRAVRIAACACVLAGFGCSGNPAAFGTRFPDNRASDVQQFLQRVSAAPPRQAGTIAVGLSAAPIRLYAYDLAERRMLWQRPIKATSAPVIAGNTVLVQAGHFIGGFDLRGGQERFFMDVDEMTLKGADGEGSLVALSIGKGQGTFAKSQVLLLRDGSVSWRRSLDSLVGVPAVVGKTVLVPWAGQFLSAVDTHGGVEIARLRLSDAVVSHALRIDDQVYVGSFHGIARISPAIGAGTLGAAGQFKLPDRELPGRPLLLDDVYTTETPPAPDSASFRIGLGWRPAAGEAQRIALGENTVYLVFYRFVFALDPADYAARWVYVHDADIVGESAQPNGLAIADERGRFAFLGADSGAALWSNDGGLPSTVVRMPEGGAGASGPGPKQAPDALATQLLAAAQDTDARMVPARLLAVQELERLPEAEATADLIELCDSSRIAPAVHERACAAIKDRTIGADFLLSALTRHAGYLEGTTSPPVGALAKAAASLKEKRAVGLLIAHLKDPGTRASDLAPLIAALGDLGDPAAADPLSDFLRLYHADPIDENVVHALELVPDALVKLSGPVAQSVLEAIANDELGAYSVRQKAQAAVDVLAAQRTSAEKKDEQQQSAEEAQVEAEVKAKEKAQHLAPMNLTTQVVDETLLPVHDQLLACLAQQKAFQARVLLVVEDGKLLLVSVLPKELQPCLEPLIRSRQFPATRSAKREQLSYTIKR